jgi:hypothetical protein
MEPQVVIIVSVLIIILLFAIYMTYNMYTQANEGFVGAQVAKSVVDMRQPGQYVISVVKPAKPQRMLGDIKHFNNPVY